MSRTQSQINQRINSEKYLLLKNHTFKLRKEDCKLKEAELLKLNDKKKYT